MGLLYYSYITLHEMQFLQKCVRVGNRLWVRERERERERERKEKIVRWRRWRWVLEIELLIKYHSAVSSLLPCMYEARSPFCMAKDNYCMGTSRG
jgi:hypothetical protein